LSNIAEFFPATEHAYYLYIFVFLGSVIGENSPTAQPATQWYLYIDFVTSFFDSPPIFYEFHQAVFHLHPRFLGHALDTNQVNKYQSTTERIAKKYLKLQ
jgi:hypothetical protein